MKFLRDLTYHLQFAVVALLTAGLVIGFGMMGQYWLSRPDAEIALSPSPTLSPAPTTTLGVPAPVPSSDVVPNAPPGANTDLFANLPQLTPGIPNPGTGPGIAPPPPAAPSLLTPTPRPSSTPVKGKYGHFPYEVARSSNLRIVGSYVRGSYRRDEQLIQEAADAFQRMTTAAQKEGIGLMPISGFRGKDRQQQLFETQIQRKGSEAEAAKWSAPPGYSEHHSGYALDIADVKEPNTDLKLAFDQTKAYRWLVTHGGRHGFELSFPRNNPQGVNYEPWHWRYIGSANAQAVFRAAKGG